MHAYAYLCVVLILKALLKQLRIKHETKERIIDYEQ